MPSMLPSSHLRIPVTAMDPRTVGLPPNREGAEWEIALYGQAASPVEEMIITGNISYIMATYYMQHGL